MDATAGIVDIARELVSQRRRVIDQALNRRAVAVLSSRQTPRPAARASASSASISAPLTPRNRASGCT